MQRHTGIYRQQQSNRLVKQAHVHYGHRVIYVPPTMMGEIFGRSSLMKCQQHRLSAITASASSFQQTRIASWTTCGIVSSNVWHKHVMFRLWLFMQTVSRACKGIWMVTLTIPFQWWEKEIQDSYSKFIRNTSGPATDLQSSEERYGGRESFF